MAGQATSQAQKVPWGSFLNEDLSFKSSDELKAHFDAVGAFDQNEIITYCGGGMRQPCLFSRWRFSVSRKGWPFMTEVCLSGPSKGLADDSAGIRLGH